MPRVIGDDLAGGPLPHAISWTSGTRAIAFIGDAVADPFGFTSSRDRERGFTDELATAGREHPGRLDRTRSAWSIRGPRPGASDAQR